MPWTKNLSAPRTKAEFSLYRSMFLGAAAACTAGSVSLFDQIDTFHHTVAVTLLLSAFGFLFSVAMYELPLYGVKSDTDNVVDSPKLACMRMISLCIASLLALAPTIVWALYPYFLDHALLQKISSTSVGYLFAHKTTIIKLVLGSYAFFIFFLLIVLARYKKTLSNLRRSSSPRPALH